MIVTEILVAPVAKCSHCCIVGQLPHSQHSDCCLQDRKQQLLPHASQLLGSSPNNTGLQQLLMQKQLQQAGPLSLPFGHQIEPSWLEAIRAAEPSVSLLLTVSPTFILQGQATEASKIAMTAFAAPAAGSCKIEALNPSVPPQQNLRLMPVRLTVTSWTDSFCENAGCKLA